jgi:hypothetical protein
MATSGTFLSQFTNSRVCYFYDSQTTTREGGVDDYNCYGVTGGERGI